MKHDASHDSKGTGSRPGWWTHIVKAARIMREREPFHGLRLEMTVPPDQEPAAVQYRLSDLVHGAIALAGGPPTTPDRTAVDGESALREEDEFKCALTALHMPIPDRIALDDETLERAVVIACALAAMDDRTGRTVRGPASGLTGQPIALAREIPVYRIFAVRAHRLEWEAVLADATGWTAFEGNPRLVERILLAHSRRWIARQLEGSGYALPGNEAAVTLLHGGWPERDSDLAWLLLPDERLKPGRKTIGRVLRRLALAPGTACPRA